MTFSAFWKSDWENSHKRDKKFWFSTLAYRNKKMLVYIGFLLVIKKVNVF